MTGVEAALASGLLNVSGQKLVSLISSEFAAITGVKKDLSGLQDIHAEITSWLSSVSDRARQRNDPSHRWVMKLRNLANDIYDLIDEVDLEDEKHKIHNDRERHAIADLCAKPKLLLFRRKVAHKIKAIKVTFDAIVKQRSNVNTILQSFQVDQPVQSRNNKTAGEQSLLSNAQESKIPSRDHVKTEIISKLLESNNGQDGHIISIVGLGGSGKTTLARHICHDDKMKGHFKDSIFWVHVSQEFSWEKLIGKLFEAIIEEKSDLHAQQHMLRAISNKLSKKFLLVLDDAWHEDRHDWENFLVHINNGTSGSKILLTTRNQNVAKAVESKLEFNLPLLSKDKSWSFFLKSSGWIEEDLDSDFIIVGKDIVKKCGGVLLAIKTLGSVLQEKRRISTWRAIRESNLWDEEDIEGRVFASLKLSYIHLKDHLKQCFTFCSIFPKGYIFSRDHLIEQWIAHGFIKWMKEEQPEDVGSDYYNSLVKGGFLQEPPETEHNEIRRKCWMHDLINDLAQYILQNEVVTPLTKNITMDCALQCRYLSLTSLNEDVERGFEKVRALYVAEGNPSLPNLVKKSGQICSVVLDYKFDTPFPSFILRLQYLGYLEIHNASFNKFPEAISDCWNLQSLHFIKCNGFVTLPESIGKLRKLRTLELDWITDLESLPQSIGDCGDLQSLKLIYCKKLSEIPLSISKIENLRGLHIVDCDSIKQHNFESIGEFSNLQTFILSGYSKFLDLPCKSLCPMLCMCTLDLSRTNIAGLPQWVTTTSTLECIDLHHFSELLELPKGIGNLKRLIVLNIKGCDNLRSLPSGLGQLTRLRKLGLFVVGCGEDDASISELENLDKLSGQLEITNLKYLKDPADAGKCYLKHMNNIQSLVLDWSLSEIEEELVFDMEKELGVLRALEPPSQIKDMKIIGYRGHCLPRWMMKQNDSSYYEAIMLKQTGPCEFISLNELTLKNCANLKQMQGLWVLPSLKSLFLEEMANLEELWIITSEFGNSEEEIRGQCCFPALSYISISGCPRLSVKPYFPPSLEKLHFCKSNMQLLSPVSFSQMLPSPVDESSSSYRMHSAVSHLKKLELTEIMMGSSFGWELLQHHTQLETLSIGLSRITELPESIRSLTSLQKLSIRFCPTLGVLPDWLGELCPLRSLCVRETPMMQRLPQSTRHLRSLVTMEIGCWDNNLKQLPDVIQHLTSLECLNLTGFDALTELPEWIGQLSALRRLYIQNCPALECLPQSIQLLSRICTFVFVLVWAFFRCQIFSKFHYAKRRFSITSKYRHMHRVLNVDEIKN